MQARFTPQAERKYLDALSHVRAYPQSGHMIPEFPDLPHRELPAQPYRFFCRVVDDTA